LPLSDYPSSHNSPHKAALYLIHVDMAQKEWRWRHEPLTPGEDTRLTHSEDSTQLWPPGEEGSTTLEKPSHVCAKSSAYQNRLYVLLFVGYNVLWASVVLLAVFRPWNFGSRCDRGKLPIYGNGRSSPQPSNYGYANLEITVPFEKVTFNPEPDHYQGLDASFEWIGLNECEFLPCLPFRP
jgi:hypothetical protein